MNRTHEESTRDSGSPAPILTVRNAGSQQALRSPLGRRDFLKSSALAVAASTVGGWRVVADEPKPYRVGLIGCGWYGKSDLFRLIQVAPVEVVSLCDVDKRVLEGAAQAVAQRQKSKKVPRAYADYRAMLKERDLDIVIVATPDHWHALPAIAALEAGADVYLEKPITVDVLEGEAILAAARQHGRVVQVGTQRKSTPHLVEAKQNIVAAGLLGKVAQVEMCCHWQIREEGNPPASPVPDFLDYEMWTGPAPLRSYDKIPHKRWWRAFMEYGNGIMGDLGIHLLDTVRWMLDLGWPKRISSTGGIFVQKADKSNITDTQTATFEYEDLNVGWNHRTWGAAADPKYFWAMTLCGDKGTLKASVWSYDFIPLGGGQPIHRDAVYEREQYPEDIAEPDMELHAAPATRAHMRDFLCAVATRGHPVADIEQGHISTASCILANVAMALGRPLVYDPARRLVVGDAEATRRLRRPYRAPWQHPADAL